MTSRAHRSARHGRRTRRAVRIPVIAGAVATVAALGAAWAGTQALQSPASSASASSAAASSAGTKSEALAEGELPPGTVVVPPADAASASAEPSASSASASPAPGQSAPSAGPAPAGSKSAAAGRGATGATPAAKPKQAAPAPKTAAKAFAPGYDSSADGQQALDAALRAAAADGKQVLLDFGANWCGNCKAADKVFGQTATNALLGDSYHLVKIDIGSQSSANFSILRKYSTGGGSYKMPVLIVLSPSGSVRTDTHQTGNPAMTADGLGAFLRQWS
ncbi:MULTISPECIES: thioredoxin family protein [unclassified Streptomyces]|uniref:thioredoxin family protein n=1 Tax=unclassified Streptomyces TaxID=2593676 RepID=UPI00225045F7|nr:thioredoxin family protein [Streptomyces sp. NBC_01551]MCX4529587.1 thioredoxin family protein [Streptomyces sp. NBC_01551]